MTRGKWALLIVLVLLAAVAAWLLLGSQPAPDDQQIAALIMRATEAVQEKRVGKLMGCIADDYWDGTYTKQDIRELARAGLIRPEQYRVVPYRPDIRVTGETATAGVEVEIAMYSRAGEASRERYQVRLELMKTRRGWQVFRATGWTAASAQFGEDLPAPPPVIPPTQPPPE